MNPQEQMRAKIESLGLPYKEVKVFGNTIIVKSYCAETAKKWQSILAKFCATTSLCEWHEDAKANRNTVLKPTQVTVWLIGGTIARRGM